MPLFTLICLDKPNSLELRMANREAHLAYVATFGDRVKLGGPMLDDAGQMAGSLLIVEAGDMAEAQAFSADDPYARAGLFQKVEIRQFRVVVGGVG